MRRALVYLFIFALAANVAVYSLAFLTDPFLAHGQSNTHLVLIFLLATFAALTLTIGLIISIFKVFRPSHKLPHLLIRDSLVASSLVSLGITGLLVLQLLRAATVVNVLLWLVIIGACLWILRSLQRTINQPPTNSSPRLPVLKRKSKNN